MLDELADLAEHAYRTLVWDDPDFRAYYAAATPIREITRLELGSRPARRGAAGAEELPDLDGLRAIPWAFAWSQSRANVPAWYGVGTALEAFSQRHGHRGRELLAEAYREWPFFSTSLENVELGLAIADPTIASRYAALAGDGAAMRRIATTIADEHERTVAALLAVTGHERLMDRSPRLQRSIGLRNPYVDVLSEVQLRCLRRLRSAAERDPERRALERLLQLTVSGVAAGLQHTG
jgi:phosphoenolpyruvate carboxylase